jgi:hypothetical protein
MTNQVERSVGGESSQSLTLDVGNTVAHIQMPRTPLNNCANEMSAVASCFFSACVLGDRSSGLTMA